MIKTLYLLFRLKLKSVLHTLPRTLAVTAVFALLIFLIGFAGTKLLYRDATTTQMNIAVVLPDDSDMYTQATFSFLNNIDTVKKYCSFHEMPKEAAFSGLTDGTVYAVILVPDNFFEHIMNGTNTPAEVILPKSGKISSSPVFRALVNAGVGDLAVAQAGIYAVDDLYRQYCLEDEVAKAELYLNETYLSYALERSVYFEEETVRATGSLELPQFYMRTGILLLLIFSSIALIDSLAPDTSSFTAALRRRCIPPAAVQSIKAFAVSLPFYVILGVFLLASSHFTLATPSVTAFPLLILAIYCTISFAQTLLSMSSNYSVSVIALFMITLTTMFVSGSIIPLPYLPKPVQSIAALMPTTYLLELFGDILSGLVRWKILFANIILCGIYSTLQTVFIKIKS